MSAETAFTAAARAGLRIDLDGEDLLLEADGPPPDDVLALIARLKREIVAELRRRDNAADWDLQDWHGYFGERAGILEFDADLPRGEAEARAYEDCIAEWLKRHPVTSNAGCCIQCGGREHDGAAVVPFGTGVSGQEWLHPACWPSWSEARRATAIDALERLGFARPQSGATR